MLTVVDDRYEVSVSEMPPLRLQLRDAPGAFTVDDKTLQSVLYRVEAHRGYASLGDLWSPGYFRTDLAPGAEVTLVASTESSDTIGAELPFTPRGCVAQAWSVAEVLRAWVKTAASSV